MATQLLDRFEPVVIRHVPRIRNEQANEMAQLVD
jgi:hypothetical protein